MNFDENFFRNKVANAINHVRRVLDTNKHPQYASDIRHAYEDKYLLSHILTNSVGNFQCYSPVHALKMIAANLNCLKSIGLSEDGLRKAVEWRSQNRHVSLRFISQETCTFVRMEECEFDSSSRLVTEFDAGDMSRITTKFVTKAQKIRFRIGSYWAQSQHLINLKHQLNPILTLLQLSYPISVHRINLSLNFNINRYNSKCFKCFTPYRNPDVEAALKHCLEIRNWSRRVSAYMKDRLFRVPSGHGLDLNVLSTSTIFQPMLPLLVYNSDNQSSSSSSTVILDSSDVNKLLYEQMRSMQEKFDVLSK
eukprot:gene11070-23135_t